MISTIRFLKMNRYRREIGTLDTGLGYGVHDALVRRGIAEFVEATDTEPRMSVAAISEPVLSESEPARASKSRRFHPKES